MNRRRISKIFSILVVIAIIVTAYFYPDWYITQINKVCGVYYVWRGDRALRKCKFQQAIDYYQRGLVLYPGHYSAWFNLGNIYVLYEDSFSAIDAYENAIKYNPNYVNARMNYGIVSAEYLGDFDGALDQYNTILNMRDKKHIYIPYVFNNLKSYKTSIGLAYYNMGVTYRLKSIYQDTRREHQMEYLQKSIAAYNNAIEYLPDNYETYYNLGLAYHLYGDTNNAGLAYCKAIALEPLNYEAHYNLAILLRRLKYYQASIAEMQKATLLITEKEGRSNRQRYIFDVLNDISRRYMETKDSSFLVQTNLSSSKTVSDIASDSVTYVNGNLVLSNDFDNAMLDNFRTCSAKDIFTEDVDADDKTNQK